MIAYVLIQTESLGIPVADRLREIPGVVSADDIDGPYDAIAVARSDSSTALLEGIVEPIRRLDGVQRALVAPLSDGAVERHTAERAA
jgi:hypothetical protein